MLTITNNSFKCQKFILPKIDEVRFIATHTNAACICLSETWLDESVFDSEFSINNYSLRRKDRNRHGGGVAIYIRRDIAFNSRKDLDHPHLEATFIDIILPKTKAFLCGVLYRPPKQTNFHEMLETVFSNCSSDNSNESILLGDFNTNWTSTSKCHFKCS